MLKTENPNTSERRILSAARARLYRPRSRQPLLAFFEHGQWWVENRDTGAQWSVVDAEGGQSVDGFDFENVTEGTDR